MVEWAPAEAEGDHSAVMGNSGINRNTPGNEAIEGESYNARYERYLMMNALQALRRLSGHRFDLIPVRALVALADMYEAGTAKYAEWDWWVNKARRTGPNGFAQKLLRHFKAYVEGEKCAPDNKHPHLMSVAFHAFSLYEYDAFEEKEEK